MYTKLNKRASGKSQFEGSLSHSFLYTLKCQRPGTSNTVSTVHTFHPRSGVSRKLGIWLVWFFCVMFRKLNCTENEMVDCRKKFTLETSGFLFCFFFLIKTHGFLFLPFIYLFLIALGLHCCKQAFSSCGEWHLLSSYTQRSRCSGWSCWSAGSGHMGFSCSMQAPEPRLSNWHAWPLLLHNMWNLPRPGIEPTSPSWQMDSYPLYHQASPKINVVVSSSLSM